MKSEIEKLQDKIAQKTAELKKDKEQLEILILKNESEHSGILHKNLFNELGANIEILKEYVRISAIDPQKDENFIETWLQLDGNIEQKIKQALDNLTIGRNLENAYGGLKFSVYQIKDKLILIQDDTNELYKILIHSKDDTYVGEVTKENKGYIHQLQQQLTDKLSFTTIAESDSLDLIWNYKINGNLEQLPGQITEAIDVLKNYKIK